MTLFGALDRTLVSAHDTASLGWVVDKTGAMRVAHALQTSHLFSHPKGSASGAPGLLVMAHALHVGSVAKMFDNAHHSL